MNMPIYVIDTNILVDYPDISPPEQGEVTLKEPTIDLSEAHIVIPTAVVRELSTFKREVSSERGKNARLVLKRLRSIFESRGTGMDNSYHLASSVQVGKQAFSVLPVHKDFKNCLPFAPSDDDMDGQIILAALATEFICRGLRIDGTADIEDATKWLPATRVVLLTNDNGLAIRANERGLTTSRYGYRLPPPYTGRREVLVPNDILVYFMETGKVELDVWQTMVPSEAERKMVANEFIIMQPEDKKKTNDVYQTDKYFRHIGRYDAKSNMITALEYADAFPEPIRNEGQAIYAEALMNPDFSAVICTGPAGSGKTYMATVYGYNACLTGQYIGVTVVPCASESRIGSLPGDMNEKMDPEVQPLKNALRNSLLKTDQRLKVELRDIQQYGARASKYAKNDGEEVEYSINRRLNERVEGIWNAWFSNLPIENARGRDFSYEIALYDEFQDQSAAQADTLIKRLGAEGKIVITGDVNQVHAPYLDAGNNGLVYASELLYDNPLVAQVHFTENEVVRHPLVRMIAERQKHNKQALLGQNIT